MLAPPVAATEPAVNGERRKPFALAGVLGCLAIAGVAMAIGSRPSDAKARSASVTPSVEGSARAGSAHAAEQPAFGETAIDRSRAGIAAFRSADVATAIQQFTAAIDADPNDAAALNNLGQALVRAGRASEAVAYFDRAVERSPGTWAYHFNRARAYGELQAWPQAIEGYRRAAVLFPEDYATQFNLARALQANGELPAAIESFQRAVSLAPGQPGFLLSLAAAQEAAQRPADAVASYRRYLELEPASADADKIKDRIARLTTP